MVERACIILVAIAKSEPSPGVAHLGERGIRQTSANPWRIVQLQLQYLSRFHDRGYTNTCGSVCMPCLTMYIASSIISSSSRFHPLLVHSLPFYPRPFSPSLLSRLFPYLIVPCRLVPSIPLHPRLCSSLPSSTHSRLVICSATAPSLRS